MRAMFGTRSATVKRKESRGSSGPSSGRSYSSSDTSDNQRQKAQQVEAMLSSLGPMLGPAPSKPRATPKKTHGNSSDRTPAPRHADLASAAPWNAPRRILSQVDSDEEFVSFTRPSPPPSALGLSTSHHTGHPYPFSSRGTVASVHSPEPVQRTTHNTYHPPTLGPVRKANAIVQPDHTPRRNGASAQTIHEQPHRSRSKSLGAHTRSPPTIQHKPPLPPAPARTIREPTRELSFFESDWGGDDPFARLPPPSHVPPSFPPDLLDHQATVSALSVKKSTIPNKQSMPNLEGIWQRFLVEADEEDTQDSSLPDSASGAPLLGRSMSANAVDAAGSAMPRPVSVARRTQSHQALALRARTQTPRYPIYHSSASDLRYNSGRHNETWSDSGSYSRISRTPPMPTGTDEHRSSALLDAFSHLEAVQEEFRLSAAATAPDSPAAAPSGFPTPPLSLPRQRPPPWDKNAELPQLSTEKLLPPIVTDVTRGIPLATPPLESALSWASSRSEDSQAFSPFTPQSSRPFHTAVSSPSASAPPVNFCRPVHMLPRATSPPHGPLPRPPDLFIPARTELQLTPPRSKSSREDASSSHGGADADFPSFAPDTIASPPVSRTPSPEPDAENVLFIPERSPGSSPLSPDLQAFIKADLHKSGALSRMRRQQRQEFLSSTTTIEVNRCPTPNSTEGDVQWGYAV
ncbi:hypothetical protein PUNSTDRAFT_132804 [Punctularia strigosozonata HHB-11173 SS5]|uniref:uncharacterized protein n=1 Tax=Punctularia strigosozonata (strain HHB-11173) TaxID=741275 RepID=UPI0004417E0F|nr:uncharacterized protein PUNSTDRAFT_132804 [Punctularia strigosozonata HHB-11173 SS5]EIN10730.1 hypothetical protein PUNSTDRAFT_132804 [Punctularia strigosozonata HHB-11173 SS5]